MSTYTKRTRRRFSFRKWRESGAYCKWKNKIPGNPGKPVLDVPGNPGKPVLDVPANLVFY